MQTLSCMTRLDICASRDTGKEQDAESGLDQFQFRNYAPTMGRWIRPDPGWAQAMDLANPQSLNQ